MGVLGILGTVHTDDLREEYRYPLQLMEQLILEFQPDIICGEVRPEDWERYIADKSYEGYLGPSEYRRSIIPLCEKQGITFAPVDWFEFDLTSLDYFQDQNDEEKKDWEKRFENIYETFFSLANKGVIPFNNRELDEWIRYKHYLQGKLNPDVDNVMWVTRNLIMVERIKKVMEANPGKRILCTVGCEHNYFYLDYLKRTSWEIVYPLK